MRYELVWYTCVTCGEVAEFTSIDHAVAHNRLFHGMLCLNCIPPSQILAQLGALVGANEEAPRG